MTEQSKKRATTILFVVSLLLVATNLRAPFTSVAPVLSYIGSEFQLSSSQLGLFSALPLFVFATFSPFVSRIARRWGMELTLFLGVLTLTLGSIVRVIGPLSAAVVGTMLVGAGIAIGNVLIPSFLKRDFPTRIGLFTAFYGLSMAIASTIGSAAAVPLAERFEATWRASLSIFIVLGMVSAIVWAFQLRHNKAAHTPVTAHRGPPLWRYPLAWHVTLFLGLNSFLYYITIAWVPAILVSNGFSEEAAGNIHGLMQFTSGTAGLAMAPFLARLNDQRPIALVAAGGLTLSLLGMQWMPAHSATWALILGFFGGAVFLLGLAFTGMRARTVEESAALSGMAQSIGYLLATTGPSLMGWVYDRTQNWNVVLNLCVALTLVMIYFGWQAGKNIQIGDLKPRS